MNANNWTYVLDDTSLQEGEMTPVYPLGVNIVLSRVSSAVYAVSGKCVHMACPLFMGKLEGYTISCPCHDWRFDVNKTTHSAFSSHCSCLSRASMNTIQGGKGARRNSNGAATDKLLSGLAETINQEAFAIAEEEERQCSTCSPTIGIMKKGKR